MGGAGAGPLTLGTAGHVDHGKTALVRALTGVDCDRLAEERRRGITIALGYAPLTLPSGRRLSVVDVPGHERFVRTMVAGAAGVDLFLMVIAADDGVMPQTREHARVLAALRVRHGVVAVTKCDVREPDLAPIRRRFADHAVVPCSARTGAGLGALRAALDAAAAAVPPRALGGPLLLHVDRSFTLRGAGTVVTGTLWSGTAGRGDEVVLIPSGRRCRVRSVQVHDAEVDRATAGQRVALNLAGVGREEVAPGDAIAGEPLPARHVLDVRLDDPPAHGTRVMVHHGARQSAARVSARAPGVQRLRCERPLIARPGDRLVLRSIAPPDTLGGGEVLAPSAPPRSAPQPARTAPPAPPPLDAAARELEDRLRAAGLAAPEMGTVDAAALAALRAHGRATRVGPFAMHRSAADDAERAVRALIEQRGSVGLAELRDALGTSRRYAQAVLEHLDATRVTRRRPDDRRVLRRGAG